MGTAQAYRADRGRILDAGAERYKLNDIFCAAWLSHAITALLAHSIPDLLEDSAASAEELAGKAGLHAPSLYRVMRAVAANGVFTEIETGVFIHNEVSRLLRADHPFSWRGMAMMWNHKSCLTAWSQYAQVLTDGRSGIQHAFGKPLYEHLADTPGGTKAFSDAMISNSAHASKAIAKAFPFGKYSTVMDLGGGVGNLMAAILEEHPDLSAVNLEIPELQSIAEEYAAQRGMSARLENVVGNFHESIPEGADVYLIKNSLWNWSDAECSKIIGNVRAAIGANGNGRFLIIEYIIDSENAQWSTLYDLQILNMPGGRARTLDEYTELLREEGFVIDDVLYVQDETVVVARPSFH